MRSLSRTLAAWESQYLCIVQDAGGKLIPTHKITPCELDPITLALMLAKYSNAPRFGGYDVARKVHASAWHEYAEIGTGLYLADRRTWHNTSFDDQEAWISARMTDANAPRIARMAIDSTGIGMQMAERMAKKFPGRVDEVNLESNRRTELCVMLADRVENQRIFFPTNDQLRADLTGPTKASAKNGALRIIVPAFDSINIQTGEKETSHCDEFIAAVLAVSAADAGDEGGQVEIITPAINKVIAALFGLTGYSGSVASRRELFKMKKRQAKKRTPATIKRETVISAATLKHSANSRFSPLRGLSAADLTRYIESFEAGDFLRLADTMAAMERRDYTWKIAAAKARKDVSCRQWQCVPKDGYKDDPDAAAQADALRAFYSSIKVTDYRCKNVYSGVRGLVSNIMYAYNDEYSLQEIVFTPTAAGKLSAHIMRCPLGWFQLMDGYMHLRPQIASTESEELEDGGWIISKSDGVGIACAVAYQFKRMSLGDLAIYSGRCGQPGIQGKTNATYGSTEWNNMAEAVRNFKNEWSAVTGLNDIFEAIDLSLSGTLPQPIIIELMDRAIASLQRGADLSTMSAGVGSGEGASLQGEESLLITTDNCAMVSETLQTQLDPFVIAWHFGPDTEIKAGFELIPPKKQKRHSRPPHRRKANLHGCAHLQKRHPRTLQPHRSRPRRSRRLTPHRP